nr:hypothetical protein [Tanacetum cinerariifolium]
GHLLLPIPLPVPSNSRRAEIPKADTPPRKRLLLTAPRPGAWYVRYAKQQNHLQSDAATRGDAPESLTLQLVPLMPYCKPQI